MEDEKATHRRPLDWLRKEGNLRWLETHIMNAFSPYQKQEVRENSLEELRNFFKIFKRCCIPNTKKVKQRTSLDIAAEIYLDFQKIHPEIEKIREKKSEGNQTIHLKELLISLGWDPLSKRKMRKVLDALELNDGGRQATALIVGSKHHKSESTIRKVIADMYADENGIIYLKWPKSMEKERKMTLFK